MGDVAAAIATIESSRETHVQWRDWFLAHPEDGRTTPLGDAAFHAQCVIEYDNVLAVLRSCG